MSRFTVNYSERKKMWFVLDHDRDEIVYMDTDEEVTRGWARMSNKGVALKGNGPW